MSEMDINDRSPFDSIKEIDADGTERWSARKLQVLMGYARWNELKNPLERGLVAARNQGYDVDNGFLHVSASSPIANLGRNGHGEDYRLSRFAAYLVAMNGDPNKPEVAKAQAYFATKTREAEVGFVVPRTFAEALELAAQQQRAIEAAQAQNQKLSEELSEAAPKVGKWQEFMDSEGLIGMTPLAKVLCMSVQKMTKMLVDKGIFYTKVYQGRNHRMPYKKYEDNGMFTVKVESVNGVGRWAVYASPSGADHVMDLSQNPLARLD